jgi:hypothetical protein
LPIAELANLPDTGQCGHFVVTKIPAETVSQILLNHRLKPWRQKMWLSAKVPRDAAFAAQVQEIRDLYTRRWPPMRWSCASTRRPACSRGRESR